MIAFEHGIGNVKDGFPELVQLNDVTCLFDGLLAFQVYVNGENVLVFFEILVKPVLDFFANMFSTFLNLFGMLDFPVIGASLPIRNFFQI